MKKNKVKYLLIHYLPVYGCISTGLIYLGIGVIAILSFLRIKDGGADEASLLAYLNDYLAGKIFVWLILLGMISYITWRFYETFTDPYNYGKDARGISRRTGIALSTVADAFIAYSALQVITGTGNIQEDGQPDEQREIVGNLLQEQWGDELTIAIGVIIGITAFIQLIYGITQGYRERLEIEHMSKFKKYTIHILAWAGYFARGVILGIIGYFFLKAGLTEEAQFLVNTDKAFDFIGDHVGHFYFILIAAATICYGFFMFALGIAYDIDAK